MCEVACGRRKDDGDETVAPGLPATDQRLTACHAMPRTRSKQSVAGRVAWAVLLVASLVPVGAPSVADSPSCESGVRPCCPTQGNGTCEFVEWSSSNNAYEYEINGRRLEVTYSTSRYFNLNCNNEHSVENPALPRFSFPVKVSNISLQKCNASKSSYARVLSALNVTATLKLHLSDLPAKPALRADHFQDLENLTELEVSGSMHGAPPVLSHGVFDSLHKLVRLSLKRVQWDGVSELLPDGLAQLELRQLVNGERGEKLVAPKAMSKLSSLLVDDEDPVTVDAVGAPVLKTLVVGSPRTALARGANVSGLRELRLNNWAETRPDRWSECGQLERLHLHWQFKGSSLELPKDWVSACGALRVLKIWGVNLMALPAQVLQGAELLLHLEMVDVNLMALPPELLNNTRNLTHLNLSRNRLTRLKNNTFEALRNLTELDLSCNFLVTADATALGVLTGLHKLLLRYNIRLGDLCTGGTDTDVGDSPLKNMTGLVELDLHSTSVARVCRDWRQKMPQLERLDLTKTNITLLKYEDMMEWRVARDAIVEISNDNTPLRFQHTPGKHDLNASALVPRLHSTVHCDCGAYWAALVFYKRGLDKPDCHGQNRSLATVPIEELTCPEQDWCQTPGLSACTCHRLWNKHVVARCVRAGLTVMPGPLRNDSSWHLLLAGNRINTVRASDLPEHLREIDLTDNAIEALDQAAADALFAYGRDVRLAGNPLRCDCDALPLVRARAAGRVTNADAVKCANGTLLPRPDKLAADCAAPSLLPVAVAVALLLVVAAGAITLAAALASAEMRLRMKIMLERRGWWPSPTEDDGAELYRYDAFVSHAHEDEEWVRELVARLERGGHRVCVHYRDWAPGEWIPAQIAASVRDSRRTLAVVSRHFLRSSWARLEFREASARARRDVTPRLIVLLLEEPAALPLDAEMRAFIQNNTYVRRDDPWFWKKLEHALPRRRHSTSRPAAAQTSEPNNR